MKVVITELEEKIKHIGTKYEASSEEDFTKVKEKKNRYNQVRQELKYQEALYHQLLGTTTLEELGATLAKSDENAIQVHKTKDELEEEQKELVNKILRVNKDISGYESKIINLQKEVRPLVDIEEEIDEMKLQREKYDKKNKSINHGKGCHRKYFKRYSKQFRTKVKRESI